MLQVTGGSLRGRRLKIAPGESIRPTASRVREALFSILGQQLDGRRVLDLYAGAGTLGIEAASRGAEEVVFVEVDGSHVELLRHNARLLEGVASHRILGLDVQRAIQRLRSEGGGFDLVFLDAPYGKGLSTKTLEALGSTGYEVLDAGAVVVVETDAREDLPEQVGRFRADDSRTYGKTGLTFYRNGETT